MELAATLAAVQTLADLPAVVAALGHEPLWEEIPVDRWLEGVRWRHDVARAAVVGHAGRWLWHAVETDTPETIAPRLGRWLGRRNRPGGLIAFDPSRRTITVSVAVEPAPVFSVPLDRPGRFALSTLRRVAADPRPGPFEQSIHVADALAHRRVDAAFFEAFRTARDQLAESTPFPVPADREALALLQLTRILFLYFIQAKGWLDGREDFLARALDDCLRRGRHPERDLLHPLFFGTLNRPAGDRTRRARAFGRIPFLNGGLFEPHPLERRRRGENSAVLWRDLFDQLFERFHFTVTEGEGDDIAPDMLGRVFERLMAPSARKASGTFYTPPAIVTQLLDAGFTALIQSRLGVTAPRAAALLTEPDAPTRGLLTTVTVLDPAAGSGAFLLGALERLSRWSPVADPTEARRNALRHNLFGVDLSATAVRLAELRLWLAVVRDDPAGPGDHVDPLPNLDCVVRQGDSLRDPLPAFQSAPLEARELATARAAAIDASGSGKRAATAALRRAERCAGEQLLRSAERTLDGEIAECLADARMPTLFAAQRGLDPELAGRLREHRKDRSRVRDASRRLRRDGELPWFHYPSHFGDVFARGGFDLVIGNPPWVRAEELPARRRTELTGRFRWWRGSGGRGFSHQPDLALAFLERSIELTRPGGAISLLLPAKIGTAGYAARARHALATGCTVHAVVDLQSDPAARFAASVYPMALVVTKSPPAPGQRPRLTLGDPRGTVPTSALPAVGPWILTAPEAGVIAESLAHRHPLLIDRGPIHLGVKTGSNAAFLDPGPMVEPTLLRDAVRGRDIRPFQAASSGRILWTHDAGGRPLDQLPPGAERHLSRWREVLAARADGRDGPWWALFRIRPALAAHRVVWPDLARGLRAAALNETSRLIPLNSCYVTITESDREAHAIAAWLNAGPIRALARLGADPAMNGFARFNARAVGAVPFPRTASLDATLASLAIAGARGDPIQGPLDAHVADLLGLDARDRRALALVPGAEDRR